MDFHSIGGAILQRLAPDRPRQNHETAARPSARQVPLLASFRNGPLAGTSDIIFAVRKVVGEHWYANFSYYADDREPSHFGNGNKLYRDGGRLCRLNLDTRCVTVLLDDPQGGVRDPQVHYDGRQDPLLLSQGRQRELPSLRNQ